MTSRLDWWIRDSETGRLVLFQAPNLALLVYVASLVLPWFTDDQLDHRLSYIGTGALIVWSLDELIRGSAPIRRVLGAVVLGWELVQLFAL